MPDFLSLPQYLAKHFESNWMAVFHQFYPKVDGNPDATATSRFYFNGEMDLNKLKDFDTSHPTALVLGIKEGDDCRTAVAIWGNGAWTGMPATESKDYMAEYTIPDLNKSWVDWDELLPDSIKA